MPLIPIKQSFRRFFTSSKPVSLTIYSTIKYDYPILIYCYFCQRSFLSLAVGVHIIQSFSLLDSLQKHGYTSSFRVSRTSLAVSCCSTIYANHQSFYSHILRHSVLKVVSMLASFGELIVSHQVWYLFDLVTLSSHSFLCRLSLILSLELILDLLHLWICKIHF